MFRKTLKAIRSKSPNDLKPLSFQIFPENISIPASHGQTVLSAILDAKVDINHSCGGMGTCGTCSVTVLQGFEKLGEKTDQEKEVAQDRQWGERERLSCQIMVHQDLVLKKNQST